MCYNVAVARTRPVNAAASPEAEYGRGRTHRYRHYRLIHNHMENNNQQPKDDRGNFGRQYGEAVKQRMLDKVRNAHAEHRAENAEALRNWRAWGSWFSWGSPVGLGLFLLAIGGFLVLLNLAGLIR